MRTVGRFCFAALHSFFILAALSCNVASGLPTKAADGNAGFASVALEPGSPAAAGASVMVEADGSLLVRPILMVHGRAVDAIIGADSAETSESMVRRIDGSLVDDATVGVTEHSEFGTSSRSSSIEETLYIGIVILAILMVCECGILIGLGRKPPADTLLAPTKTEEPEVRPSQQRQSMAESDPEQPKGKAKGLDKGAPLKGKGKGDSSAADDEDDSKAAPDPSSKGKGKAPGGGKGKGAIESPDGTPPTNEITAKGSSSKGGDAGSTNEITAKGGASKGGAKGKAGAPSPPESTESSAAAADVPTVVTWATPCNDYRRDILSDTLGMCKCGHLKADHEE